jgi:hypothetical protein
MIEERERSNFAREGASYLGLKAFLFAWDDGIIKHRRLNLVALSDPPPTLPERASLPCAITA